MLLANPAALAQDAGPAVDGAVEASGIDAHGFVPAAFDDDLRDPLTLQRPSSAAPGFFAGGLLEFADAPLLATDPQGETVRVVDDVFALVASAGAVLHERVRVDVTAPLFFSSVGPQGAQGLALGDVRLASMLTVLPPSSGELGLGVAVVPWLDLPTGAEDRFLGSSGVAGGGLVAATLEVEALTVTGNLGTQLNPSVDRGNLTGSDGLVAGIAAGWLVDDAVGLNAEVRGLAPFTTSPEAGTGAPLEGIATVRYLRDDGSHLLGGLAAGLTSGVGAAAFRVFVGGGFGQTRSGGVGVARGGGGGGGDRLHLQVVVTRDGAPVQGAVLNLDGPEPRTAMTAAAPLGWDVRPDTVWKATATLGSCLAADGIAAVGADDTSLELPLERVVAGLVKVTVLDGNGAPLPGAVVRLESAEPSCVPEDPVALAAANSGVVEVGVGEHRVIVERNGYTAYEEAITIASGDEREVLAVLIAE